jgi:small subunit ribosomal protein S2e
MTDKKADKKAEAKPRGAAAPRGEPRGRGEARGRGAPRGEAAAAEGDAEGGFGRRGRRGRRGRGRGRRGGRDAGEKKDWVPVTKLGRLVKDKKITSLEEIFLFSMPIKEPQIVDYFLGEQLKDEVMKISPVQKQSAAGQRTRFKAYVVVGDNNGHLGLGVKCAKEVATAIRAAIMLAKLTLIPIRRGYWGSKFGEAHTVPTKVTGKCGSVRFRLIPAPKGTGIVAAKAAKKILTYAGVRDCYTSSRGQSGTMGNLMTAVYRACAATYGYLTPDLWPETAFKKTPFQQYTDFLKESTKPKAKGE